MSNLFCSLRSQCMGEAAKGCGSCTVRHAQGSGCREQGQSQQEECWTGNRRARSPCWLLLDSAAPSPFAEVPLCAQRLLAALMTQGLGLQKVHVAVGTHIKRLQAQPALSSQLGGMSCTCA